MIMVHHLNESRSQRILRLLEELAVPYEIQFYWRDAHRMATPLPGAPGLQGRHRARRPLSLGARMSAGGRGPKGAGAILI